MTTRYQKSQIEDVARLLEGNTLLSDSHKINKPNLVRAFADLFAADNPSHWSSFTQSFVGFDREQFLAACGLKKEG
ncbi:hypothetical protein LCGC14_2428870 [marine sediment metagenome]|uniref:Uncharacterized protein n=1 Tax=marine sediment metagenome TaxID=412755 RepID=A0A0F9DZG9_9ZZZZ